MASRNQYTYTPGYTGANRQAPQRSGARPASYQRPPQGTAQPGTARRPVAAAKARPTGDTLILTLLFIVAPLCGILGVFVKTFLWVFVGIALLIIAMMWMLKSFAPRGRTFLSGVLLALCTVAMLSLVEITPKADTFPQYGAGDPTTAQNGGNTNNTGTGTPQGNNAAFIGMGGDATATPPIDLTGMGVAGTDGDAAGEAIANPTEAAATADPYATPRTLSAAEAMLDKYLQLWVDANFEEMVQYTTPTWRKSVASPATQLFFNHGALFLQNWTITSEAQAASADSATLTVVANLIKDNSLRTPVTNKYEALMFNVDGVWYVDPASLRSGIPLTEPTPTAQPIDAPAATPTPVPTTSSKTKLWYNTSGGKYYHSEQKCKAIATEYYSKMKSFTYADINKSPYSKLVPCPTCNAPKR